VSLYNLGSWHHSLRVGQVDWVGVCLSLPYDQWWITCDKWIVWGYTDEFLPPFWTSCLDQAGVFVEKFL